MDTPTKTGLEAVNTRIGATRAELCGYIVALEKRVEVLEKAAAEKKYGKGS